MWLVRTVCKGRALSFLSSNVELLLPLLLASGSEKSFLRASSNDLTCSCDDILFLFISSFKHAAPRLKGGETALVSLVGDALLLVTALSVSPSISSTFLVERSNNEVTVKLGCDLAFVPFVDDDDAEVAFSFLTVGLLATFRFFPRGIA